MKSDINDPKRPFPRDSLNSAFNEQQKDFDNAFWSFEGKNMSMAKIEEHIKYLNHLDKHFHLNARTQKQANRLRLFQQGRLTARYTNDHEISTSK